MRCLLHRASGQRGAIAVEFALVASLLLILVIGIVEFGRAYNARVEVTGAVREGVRALALGQSSADAEQAVVDASPGLSPPPSVTSSATCPNGSDQASITAAYPLEYGIPFVGTGTWTITATGVMRCGG